MKAIFMMLHSLRFSAKPRDLRELQGYAQVQSNTKVATPGLLGTGGPPKKEDVYRQILFKIQHQQNTQMKAYLTGAEVFAELEKSKSLRLLNWGVLDFGKALDYHQKHGYIQVITPPVNPARQKGLYLLTCVMFPFGDFKDIKARQIQSVWEGRRIELTEAGRRFLNHDRSEPPGPSFA